MGVLRWMFTMEGGAATPRLSAATGAVLAGVLGGIIFSFRMSDGWGVVVGIGTAAVFFLTIYPKLREEHERQQLAGSAAAAPSLHVRLRLARPSLLRLAVLFAALLVGAILAVAIGSPWVLLVVMVAALIGVGVMRAVTGS